MHRNFKFKDSNGKDWDDRWETRDWVNAWDWSRDNRWMIGAALLAIGLLFLSNNLGLTRVPLYNWWAIFILIPGLNMLGHTYSRHRDTGYFTASARRSGLAGFVLVSVSFTFLFNLSWSFVGPLLLVLAGLYLLLMVYQQ